MRRESFIPFVAFQASFKGNACRNGITSGIASIPRLKIPKAQVRPLLAMIKIDNQELTPS